MRIWMTSFCLLLLMSMACDGATTGDAETDTGDEDTDEDGTSLQPPWGWHLRPGLGHSDAVDHKSGMGSSPKRDSVHGSHLDPVLGADHRVDALPRWVDDEPEPEEVPTQYHPVLELRAVC